MKLTRDRCIHNALYSYYPFPSVTSTSRTFLDPCPPEGLSVLISVGRIQRPYIGNTILAVDVGTCGGKYC